MLTKPKISRIGQSTYLTTIIIEEDIQL